jgi:predicted amidohydrolase
MEKISAGGAGISITKATGEDLGTLLGELAALRVRVFRDWPYLYQGDLAYEAEYLRTYLRSPDAAIFVASAGAEVIGASTCLRLVDETANVRAPFEARGWDPANFFFWRERVAARMAWSRHRGRLLRASGGARARGVGLRVCVLLRRGAAGKPSGAAGRVCATGRVLGPPWLHALWRPELPDVLDGSGGDGADRENAGLLDEILARGAFAVSRLRLGVCAYGITAPPDFESFAQKFDAVVAEGAAGGAQLLLLPEYASVEAASAGGVLASELETACAQTEALMALFAASARRHGVWLLPGTLPWRGADGRILNRAPLIAPDGSARLQDKRTMTRFEAERWGIHPGEAPRVFETPFGCVGIAICYDVEFPTLVRAQVEAGAWLILAPSCTDSLHGFNRVRLSARARALENQCFVAVAPTVGLAPGLATLDENHGYAAVFGPVDRGFADDGVIARGRMDEAGWIFADLDRACLDAVREDGAVRNHRDWPSQEGPT